MAKPTKTARVAVSADAVRYRIKDGAPKHYIDGRLLGAGAVVTLKPGVQPGLWLEQIGKPEAAE